jgi:hypothetical protein
MGFEDEVEQSLGRPCRLADSRSKRTYELTSSIVLRGTSFHRSAELEFSSYRVSSCTNYYRLAVAPDFPKSHLSLHWANAKVILTSKNSVVVSIARKTAKCQNSPCTDCEILRLPSWPPRGNSIGSSNLRDHPLSAGMLFPKLVCDQACPIFRVTRVAG